MTEAAAQQRPLSDRAVNGWIALALALAALLLYLPARGFDFVNHDDPGYITAHDLVQQGLTWEGVKFAFTGTHLLNWHPLTTLSHMAMCEWFGLNAGAHHLLNILIHALNAALLFYVLFRLTKARWPAAMVAALLALHPLHVESVAWISERKDGLCLMFWLLTVLAHLRWVEDRTPARYAALAGVFAIGILTKPMIVTLPCALLLLDFWPLNRIKTGSFREIVPQLKKPLLEKLPLFALAGFLAIMTVNAQKQGAMIELERLPLDFRIGNALVAYSLYLGKLFWPANLAVFYPHPGQWPAWGIAGAAVIFLGVSAVAIRTLRTRPHIAVGWFWFVGALVPVIGILQVGDQAIADRYAYIPLIGVYAAICWEAASRLKQIPSRVIAGAAGVILLACALTSARQIRHWQDSETLFRRALAVTEGNDIAHNNLAVFLASKARLAEAREHLLSAYEINPHNPEMLANLAKLASASGNHAGAARYEAERLEEIGGSAEEYLALAQTFALAGDIKRVAASLEEALNRNLELVPALNALAGIRASHPDAALRNGATALRLAQRAVDLTGGADPVPLDTLAMAQAETGDFAAAAKTIERAVASAQAAGQGQLIAPLQRRLELYRNNRPFRRGQ